MKYTLRVIDNKVKDSIDIKAAAEYGWTIPKNIVPQVFQEGLRKKYSFEQLLKMYDDYAKQMQNEFNKLINEGRKNIQDFKNEYVNELNKYQ